MRAWSSCVISGSTMSASPSISEQSLRHRGGVSVRHCSLSFGLRVLPHMFTPHGARSTYSSVATEIGVNPYILKLLLNHKLPKGDVTAGYINLGPEELRPSTQRVTDRLRELGLPL